MPPTKARPVREHSKCLGQPEAKSNRFQGVANDFWLQLCNHIQVCADTGNLKGMYDGIKQAIGPMQSRTAPLKFATGDAINDKSKQMER